MSKHLVTCLVLALGFTACSESDDTKKVVDTGNAPPQQSGPILVEPKDGASVSIAPPPSAPPPQLAPPSAAPMVATGPGSKDEYNGEVVTRDDDGKRLDGEALLKKAMMIHVEGKGNPYPERIEELVEKGTLKSLPPAPNGQKWAIDPATKQIVLK